MPPVRQAQISQHGTHRGRNRYQPSAHTLQHRGQQLSYFISVSSNVTDNFFAPVLIGDLSPW